MPKSTQLAGRLLVLLLLCACRPAAAQMPMALAERIQAAGRVLDLRGMAALFAPLHAQEPYAGVQVARDLAYGDEAAQRLDLFVSEAAAASPRAVLVFVHGGGFQAGDKHRAGSPFYDNVMLWAAREGFVGVNLNYRTGLQNPWPASSEDLGLAIRWIQRQIAGRYGDPKRIFLVGHSAGAALVASYVAHPLFHGATGSGLAGALLLSGFAYDLGQRDDPVFKVYFGSDPGLYPERTPLDGLLKSSVPMFIAYAEFDLPDEEFQSLRLRDVLCAAGRCPTLVRLAGHNHMSTVYSINTSDRGLSDAMLTFIRKVQ
jgi:triacylglycerol lipase